MFLICREKGMKKTGSCPTKKQESADCFAFLGRGLESPCGRFSLRGSLRSSVNSPERVRQVGNARRERQSFIDGKRGEGRVLIPENGHEKGGLLPNQETGVRRLFCVFRTRA